MAVTVSNVNVGTQVIKIVSANTKRQELILCNSSLTPDIYLGPDSTVTSATGLPLFAGQSRECVKSFPNYKGDIYGISASGTADVRVWENSQ